MSGEVRKGERIPRRDPPPYEEADGFGQAVARDGFFKHRYQRCQSVRSNRHDDSPFIIATITGAAIKLLESL